MRITSWLLAASALAFAGCAANPPVDPPGPAIAPAAAIASDSVRNISGQQGPPLPAATDYAAPPTRPSAPTATPAPAVPPSPLVGRGSLETYLQSLSAISCPAGVKKETGETIEFKASPVPLSGMNRGLKTIGQLTYVGGYHLTSPDKRLGGLSGVDVLDDGNLLTVSDQGDFVWIDLDKEGAAPVGVRIATMRDATGALIRGKADGDSEDLSLHGGTALVSYERNDRVLAFDLDKCGAAARGAPIVSGGYGRPLREAYRDAKIEVGENSGPEPLAVTLDWYLFIGLETLVGVQGPLSARPIEAAPEFDLRIQKGAPSFVGLDLLPTGKDGRDVRAFSLHRGTDQILGAAIVIAETTLERYLDQANLPARRISDIDERSHDRFRVKDSRRLASLAILHTIDNFEGIAARQLSDGTVRLYVISDDNFSSSQRTLLMIFDLKKP